MNYIIDGFVFGVTSVLPFVILAVPFLVTLYFLWLFWSFGDLLEENKCAKTFWGTVAFDVLYFFGAGWCTYKAEHWGLRMSLGVVFTIIGTLLTSRLLNRLEKKTTVD